MRSPRLILLAAASALALGAAILPSSSAFAQSAPAAAAQQQATPPSAPWAHEASDVAVDPNIRFGLLPNGMRYAIMRNATPPGQASIRLRIDAGSLMETDAQRGLAHFIEHMAFNGTENIPEGQLLPILERLGLAFGADTNASTGFDETIYKLDLPRTDDETVDTALHILRDMVGGMLLDIEAIDRERGIVLSEERTRAGPGLRSLEAMLAFLAPGQLITERLPIGLVEVLQNAPRERFVEFYEGYYRPERATFVIVGDFDVDVMEAKVVDAFSDWTGAGAPAANPNLGVVQPRQPAVGLYVETGVGSSASINWISPPDLTPDTLAKQREDLVRGVGLAILNRRLQLLARGENPPFAGAGASRGSLFDSAELASLNVSYLPGRWAEGLAAVEQEQRRIQQFGVTQAELDYVLTEMRTGYQNRVSGAGTRRTVALAEGISSSVNSDTVFTSPQTDLEIFESVAASLTVETVNAALATVFDGDGPLVWISSPDPIEGGEAAVMQALRDSQAVAVTPPQTQAALEWPYVDFGAAAQPVSREHVADIDTTFVTFPNGVRLTIKPTTFQDDRIQVAVRIGQGYQALPLDGSVFTMAAGVLPAGGLGPLRSEQIDEVLAGRTYGAGFSVAENAFVFTGATTPTDFDLQMQVLAAYVTDAAWRAEPFEQLRIQLTQALPQLSATPGGAWTLASSGLLNSNDARWRIPSAEQIAAAQLAPLRQAVESSLSQGPIEITIVGDVDIDQAIAGVAATFGALPSRPAAPAVTAEAAARRFPAGVAEPVQLTHGGRADQALGFIAWPTVDNFSDVREARLVRLVADVMRLRLIEELREGQAVTYSPSVGANASGTFAGYGYLSASIQAPPDKLPGFFADVEKIAADLAANLITADELERARRPRVEALQRSLNTNEFWLSELQQAQTDPNRLPALRTAISDLESFTPEEVQAAAARYFAPARAYRAQVTPQAAAE